MEVIKKYSGVLLHVENNRQICATEAHQGSGGRKQAEASLHS